MREQRQLQAGRIGVLLRFFAIGQRRRIVAGEVVIGELRRVRIAAVVAGNLLLNMAFFMSHPVFTPYYTIPIAMLSLWSLLFASLMQPAEAVDDGILGQAAKA